MYQGRTAAEKNLVFGHENMGIIDELGSGVTLLKKGDRVVMPFNVADGSAESSKARRLSVLTSTSDDAKTANKERQHSARVSIPGSQEELTGMPYHTHSSIPASSNS